MSRKHKRPRTPSVPRQPAPTIRLRGDGREYGVHGGLGIPADICEPGHPWFAAIASGWAEDSAAYRERFVEPVLSKVATATGNASARRARELRLMAEDHAERTQRQGMVRPTREREDKGDVEMVKDVKVDRNERVTGFRAVTASPLERMRKRNEVSAWQAACGHLYRSQWEQSGRHEPRVTARYAEPTDQGDIREPTKRELDAKRKYEAATQAVGIILAPVLVHVVLLECTAASWAEARGHRGRQAGIIGMTTLRLALDALGEHYRLQKALDPAYGRVA